MATNRVKDLLQIVPPPPQPDPFVGELTHSSLGASIELPSDYLSFMRTYGPGSFAKKEPFFDIQNLCEFSDQLSTLMKLVHEAHVYDPGRFLPAFPAQPGLLPWGSYDQGYVFYWIVQGPPDSWPVLADLRYATAQFSLSMTDFLFHVLNHALPNGTKVITERDGIGYCPASKYSACRGGKFVPDCH